MDSKAGQAAGKSVMEMRWCVGDDGRPPEVCSERDIMLGSDHDAFMARWRS